MRRLVALGTAALLLALWTATAKPDDLEAPVRLASPPPVVAEKPKLVTERFPAIGRQYGARLLRRTALRKTPAGKVIVRMRARSRFDNPHVLAVVARRGDWLAVLHQWLPNSRAGWIRASDAEVVDIPWAIEIDRSARRGLVRHEGRVVQRFPVTVGRPGHETPVGRFAITDRLTTKPGSVYGCCILALSGRQTKLPPGWPGGDRLALHGSPGDGVGAATSTGCVRLRRADIRKLMRRVPVGTRVTIRA